MKCYICEHQPGPGGTQYHVREAAGICQDCGIGVCSHHAEKGPEPGSPLLCLQCAQLRNDRLRSEAGHPGSGLRKSRTLKKPREALIFSYAASR